MKAIKNFLFAVIAAVVLCIPANSVYAAPTVQNQQQVLLAQQIVNQQVLAFQAAGLTLTPEQLAVIQQNADLLAAQQMQAVLQAQQLQAAQMVTAPALTQAVVPAVSTNISTNSIATNGNYVLNKNTKKFHYPLCSSVGDMSPKNRLDVSMSRDEIILKGYVPCKRCNP